MERIFTADPNRPASIMALSGETITHGQLEARANRIAHLLRAIGLNRADHCAIFMESHPLYIKCGLGAHRSGLYYTNINFHRAWRVRPMTFARPWPPTSLRNGMAHLSPKT